MCTSCPIRVNGWILVRTRPDPGALFVATSTSIRSTWFGKGMACVSLGAALFNFHRPLRQFRVLSGVVVSCMSWGWSSRLLRLLVLAWALYQPLFPEPMDLDPDPHPHPPNPPQPRDPITEEEFRALFGLDLSQKNYYEENRDLITTLVLLLDAAATREGHVLAGIRLRV